jgi:hypothetical protein
METRGQACRKQGRRGRERGGGAREGEGDGQAARSHRGTAHAPPRARRKTKSPGEQAQIHSLRGFAAVHAARAPAGEGAEVAGNPRGGVHAVGSPSTARGAAGMQGQGLGKGGGDLVGADLEQACGGPELGAQGEVTFSMFIPRTQTLWPARRIPFFSQRFTFSGTRPRLFFLSCILTDSTTTDVLRRRPRRRSTKCSKFDLAAVSSVCVSVRLRRYVPADARS